jgi:hypothetical protein
MAGNGRRNADGVLLVALASGATVADAAAQAKVSERTVHRRLKDPNFCLRIRGTETAMVARAMSQLAEASITAVHMLTHLMLPGNPPFVRFLAAKQILKCTLGGHELRATQGRVAAVEEALAQVVGELQAMTQHAAESNGQGSHSAAPSLPEPLLARMRSLHPAVASAGNGHHELM